MSNIKTQQLVFPKDMERAKTAKSNTYHFSTPSFASQDNTASNTISRGFTLGFPSNRSNSYIPTSDEIKRITEGLVTSKKRSTETFFYPPSAESQREYKLPRLSLTKALKGLNTGSNWFSPDEELDLLDTKGSTRYSARPDGIQKSWNKIFPSRNLPYEKVPTTKSQRFSLIDPKQDLELANYVVKSTNAFRTEWSKYKDLKDRKFYPELHPEFVGFTKENGLKRDRIVVYREEMLKVKAMMSQAWTNKKKK